MCEEWRSSACRDPWSKCGPRDMIDARELEHAGNVKCAGAVGHWRWRKCQNLQRCRRGWSSLLLSCCGLAVVFIAMKRKQPKTVRIHFIRILGHITAFWWIIRHFNWLELSLEISVVRNTSKLSWTLHQVHTGSAVSPLTPGVPPH